MLPTNMAQVGAISLLSWIVTAVGSMAIAYGFAQAGLFNQRAGGSVFEHVAVVAVADLDFDSFGLEPLDERGNLSVIRIDERDHLQQLVEGNRDRRRLGAVFHHLRGFQHCT
jgi:hypothetical protein